MSKPVPPVDVWFDWETRATFHTLFCADGIKRMVVSHSEQGEPSYSVRLVFTPNEQNPSGAMVSVLGEHGWWHLDELPFGEIYRMTAALLYRRPVFADERAMERTGG